MQPLTNLLKKLTGTLERQYSNQSRGAKHRTLHKKRGSPLLVLIKHLPATLLLQWNKELKKEMDTLRTYFRDNTDTKKNYQDLLKTESDLRNFARQLNSMLEEERSRIAREIHDEFGQQLAAIKMSVALTKHYIGVDSKEDQEERLDDISIAIDNTMDSLRSFATELRPGILDTMGLIPSLEWLAKEFEKKTGINCYIDAGTSEQDLEKSFATGYFRICQEALTNVLKHAGAKNVVIQVYQQGTELTLSIIDDGIGIVEENILNPFSMGILGMKERANLVGGTLSIQNAPQGGTIVQLKAKIHAA